MYWVWLLKEIIKSAWDVSKIIVHPKLPISPTLVRFKPSQRTDVGLVIHANSITLTPGTITIEATSEEFLVHGLTRGSSAATVGQRDGSANNRLRGESMMFAAVAIALLVTLIFALMRAALGPTIFDRALAVNAIGTVAMLLLAVMGFLNERPEFLDLAIVYGLLNVIGTIAVLKFFRYGDLGASAEPKEIRAMTVWIDGLSWICLVAGGAFCIVGAVGLLRMPDFYTRMHAASVIETLGVGLILLGLVLQAGVSLVAVKLLIIGLLIFFASPTATHALARAAMARGQKPLLAAAEDLPSKH